MNVITISREFGSGGREVGKRLADALGYRYFDSEIIQMVAKEANLDPNYVASIIEKANYDISTVTSFSILPEYDNYTKIIVAQKKILNEITSKYNCVIVGRGAECVVDNCNKFSIFVHASKESKLKRCLERSKDKNETEKDILKKMKKIDKNRKRYHAMYYGIEWGAKENYNMTLNTTDVVIKSIIPPLAEFIKKYFEEK